MAPGSPSHASASFGFGHLVGAASDSIAWMRLLVFLSALWVSDLVAVVLEPLVRGHGLPSLLFLASALFGSVVLAGAVLGAFRWIRNPFLAAPVATVGYVVVMLPVRLLQHFDFPADMPERWRYLLMGQMNSLVWTFLFLMGLTAAVALIRPVWLALLAGAGASVVASLMFLHLLALVLLESSFHLGSALADLVGSLAGAGAFAGVFWGGLLLAGVRTADLSLPASTPAGPERLSKAFYVGSIAGSFGLVVVLGGLAIGLASREREAAFALVGLAVVLAVYGGVVNVMLWYKAWAALQDGHARTTPGKAVGLLFIPFINIYWAFLALWGWATDYNAYVARHSIRAPRMPEGLFLAYVILCIAAFVPVLGVLASVVALVLVVVMAVKICDGVNALSR